MWMHTDIQSLYLTVYNRPADWEGLLYWADQLESQGFETISAAFTQSPEFEEMYGGLSSEAQVEKLYQHLLGREADEGGLAYWAAKIDAGEPVTTVARDIGEAAKGDDGEVFAQRIDSAQEQTYGEFIDVLYAGHFGRGSDAEGKAFWVQELKASGGDVSAVIESFGNSQEYVEQYGALSSEQLVTTLYQNLFDRDPEAEGLAYWSGKLDNGELALSDIPFTVAAGAIGDDKPALEETVTGLNMPLLTLAEALDLDELPARFTLNSAAPVDGGTVTVAEAEASLAEVTALVDQAENADELTSGALFEWSLLDSAETILAAVDDDVPAHVSGADEVRVTESELPQVQLESLQELDNFVDVATPEPEPDPEPDPDPAFFDVTALGESSVDADATTTVTAEVANTGDESGTQDVVLTISDGSVTETLTESVTLAGGEDTSVDFTVDPDALGLDPGDYDLSVATDDASRDKPGALTVEAAAPAPDPAFFEVTAIGEASVDADATTSVSVEVANTGDESGTQDVVLTLSDGSVTETLTESVTLAGGEDTSVDFTVDPDALGLDAGDYDLSVATDNDSLSESGALTVEAVAPDPDPAFFDVIAIGEASVDADATTTVTAEVANTGDESGTQDVVLTITDGTITETLTESVTLTGGEDTSVDFTVDADALGLAAGEYDLTATTEDASLSASSALTVEAVAPVPDPAFFEVTAIGEASVDADATTTVTAEVANTGGESGTQDVVLTISDGSVTETLTESVTLAGGEDTSVAFTIDPAALGLDAGDYDLSVVTDNDSLSESGALTVEAVAPDPDPAFFDVIAIGEASVDADATTSVSVEVANTGDESGTQDVVLTLSDGSVTETFTKSDVTLAGGEDTSVDFTIDADALGLDPGDYDLSVATDNDSLSESGALTVEAVPPAPDPAFFEVTAIGEASVDADATTTVTAEVANSGDETGTQDVVLTITDGTITETLTESVTLTGGEGTSVDFTVDPDALGLDAGDYDLSVATDNDSLSESGALTVEAVAPSPELSIDGVTFDPEQPPVDEDFEFQIDMTESADVEPENLQLTFAVPGVTTQTYNLTPFQDDSVAFTLGADAIDQAGNFDAEFTLDAANADPAEFQKELTILAADEASIIVDALEVSDSSQLEPDDTFNVSVDLSEVAGNDVDNLSAQLVIEDAGIDEALDVDALSANGSVQLESEDLSIDEAGFYEAEIHISADNASEVNATTAFTVTTMPHDEVEIADGLELLWADDTDLFPFSAIGQVQVQYEGSNGFSAGSGVMISPQHFMTNHHVLQGSSSLAEIEEINFFDGLNGSVQERLADDAFTSGGTELDDGLWSLEGEIGQFDTAADDIAIVRLDEAIDGMTNGHFDMFWSESGDDRDLTDEDVTWAGYPVQDMEQDDPDTDDPDYFQWQAFGTIDEYADDDGQLMLSDSLMGRSGASGSPLFRETDDDGAELLGLYTGRIDDGVDQTPVAATITPEVHDWALEIMQSEGFFQDIDMAMG